jgi:UDP-N-acetyl-D-mannosaminuronate dehydrogenase
VELTADLEAALRGSDCMVIVTKHRGYYDLDLEHVAELMRTLVIVDGRTVFDAKVCREAGFVYRGVGKG